mgnify:CR=1 FL=1|tara:strand:- start:8730 stop:9791 length:1062 start_codon:yes stop_codon:yes gene_type:complete
MTAIFFDESGYTGRNLLDPVQPLFVIASCRISEVEAAAILNDAFPRFKGAELKFSDVWRRNRRGVIAICKALGDRAKDVFVWQVDKKFCVLLKMIDFLIEPVAYDAGFDFYKNAYAFKYANYIYIGLALIGSPELYDATVRAYLAFAREPSDPALERLRFQLELFASSAPEEIRFFFSTALVGMQLFHKHSNIATFDDTLEIYLTSMLASVAYWAERATDELDLFHDQSSSFFARKEMWDALMSKEVKEQWHPVANGPPVKFPLPVRSTTSLNSKASAGVQVCDLIAGLSAKIHTRPEEERETIDAILQTGFAEVTVNGLKPGTTFPEGGPERRDGPDPVDLMTQILRSNRDQ